MSLPDLGDTELAAVLADLRVLRRAGHHKLAGDLLAVWLVVPADLPDLPDRERIWGRDATTETKGSGDKRPR